MDFFEIVDENDQVIGLRARSECHGNPDLVHRVAHVLVFNSSGHVLLQKRSEQKDVQPGKWDTSVGGHVDPGENYLQAAYREMEEELGVSGLPLKSLYPSKIRNDFESENVMTYLVVYDGEICFNRTEIDEIRFWTPQEIAAALGTGVLTPNFEEEWQMWRDYSASHPA
ncbi:NUDIX domain-containing protein [uncultured Desulfuromonas sp.]|uniref:NUDIX hydrolase n=1 Tax=uncultured Desulfuromonas sp. TaxID=181013 RepID=UPI002AAABFED|nr:NUDIX domain-containing protein [uncultured Desulfuromonas sp.]